MVVPKCRKFFHSKYVPSILKHQICIQLLFTRREKKAERVKQKRMPNPWLLTLLCMHNALMHWLGAKPNDPILPTQVANQNTEFILLFPAISCHITIAVITVDPRYSCISNWVCQSEALQSTFQGNTSVICENFRNNNWWLWFPLQILHFSHKKRSYNYSRKLPLSFDKA